MINSMSFQPTVFSKQTQGIIVKLIDHFKLNGSTMQRHISVKPLSSVGVGVIVIGLRTWLNAEKPVPCPHRLTSIYPCLTMVTDSAGIYFA